ncbi:MAG: hypothetical protein HZB81_03545 [Deltaproteobacteria bacterium]|nr:hypothetical protein [Deltaproteobacteria bacterium]
MFKQSSSISKITRPKLSAPIERKRLFKLLDSAGKKPIVWLSAPAGSGKTTLVASYLDCRKLPCIWYSVDEGDADLATFFYYMGLAAKKAAPRYKKPLPLLTPEYLAGIPTFTRRWFENLYSRLISPGPSLPKRGKSSPPLKKGDTGGFVLVLDNYQDAPADSLFHEMIANGLDSIPEGVNIIVISRTEPPPQFSRLLANNKISRIGWEEIKFNLEETERFIKGQGSRGKGQEITRQLHQQTDGWAAGMVLMMEDVRATLVPAHVVSGTGFQPVKTGKMPVPPHRGSPLRNHETIFNYFASEIFNKTDKPTQEFLLKTAFLPDMTIAMAEKLTGLVHAEKILSGLNRNNYFCQRQAAQNPTYRYHPLFHDFLLKYAHGHVPPAELNKIRLQAAHILEQSGQTEQAVKLFMEAESFDEPVRLTLAHAEAFFMEGRSKTLEAWITGIPPEILNSDPRLLHLAGICRLPFNLNESRSLLERSFDLLIKEKDYPTAVAVCGRIIETAIYDRDSFKAIDLRIDWLTGIMKRKGLTAAAENISGNILVVLAYHNMNHPDILFWLGLTEAAVQKSTSTGEKLRLCNYLMAYYWFRGEFNGMTRIMKTIGPLKKEVKEIPALRLLCILLEAYYAVYARAAAEEGIALASEGLEIAGTAGIRIYDFWFSWLIVVAASSVGDFETAGAGLEKVLAGAQAAPRWQQADIQCLLGSNALAGGGFGEAVRHFRAAIDLFAEVGTPVNLALSHINCAWACLWSGNKRSAVRHLLLASQGRWANSWMCKYQGLLTRAHLAFGKGDAAQGKAMLRQGFAVAKEHGIITALFPWNKQVMAVLCARALDAGIEPEFITDYIRRHRIVPPNSSPYPLQMGTKEIISLKRGTEKWPYPVKIYTLGKFEIVKDGKPVEFSGKIQKKPLELLKAIIALGGEDVPEEKVADKLWPNVDGDMAHQSFATTLKRLRRLLGNKDAVRLSAGYVTLDRRYCWVEQPT